MYESIQGCRFIAALLVLWVHFRFVVGPEIAREHWFIQTGVGGCGVDIFFVISGFVMVACSENRNIPFRKFLTARLLRVMPLYLIYSLPFAFKEFMDQSSSLQKTVSSLILIPIFSFGGYDPPFHPYGWTIAFEIWFYLVFSSLLLNRSSKMMVLTIVSVAVATLSISSLYRGNWFLPKFLTCPLILEFLAGCLIGLYVKRISAATSYFLLVGSVACYALIVPVFESLTDYGIVINSTSLSATRAVVWGGAAVLLCFGLASLEQARRIRIPKFLKKAGDSSYTLYLAQPFLILICRKFFVFESVHLTFIVYILGSVAGSIFLSKAIEFPLIRLAKRLLSRDTPQHKPI